MEENLYFWPAFRQNLIRLLLVSIDSKENDFFKTFLVLDEKGQLKDVCEGGSKSCALFASRILIWAGPGALIRRTCATVSSFIREILSNGWYPIAIDISVTHDTKIYDIVHWEPRLGSDGIMHEHVGFYLGGGCCVSNDPRSKEEGSVFRPIEHDLGMEDLLGEARLIKAVYRHSLLGL